MVEREVAIDPQGKVTFVPVKKQEMAHIIPFEKRTVPKPYHSEQKLYGHMYGHDIHQDVLVSRDGKSVFDQQPTEVEKLSQMVAETDNGLHTFTNYPYESQIVGRDIVAMLDYGMGRKEMYAKVYMLGDHYHNGIGRRIPQEEAWNTEHQDETEAYIKVIYNPLKPERVSSTLLWPGSDGYRTAIKLQDNERLVARGKMVEEQVNNYRDAQDRKDYDLHQETA